MSQVRRQRWYLAFALLSVAGTSGLAALYLRSALRHRAAVERGARDVTLRFARALADTIEARIAAGSVPLYRTAREVAFRTPVGGSRSPHPGPDVVLAASRVQDSLAGCHCGLALPVASLSYWDPVGRELVIQPASRRGPVQEVLEGNPNPESFSTLHFALSSAGGSAPVQLAILPLRNGTIHGAFVVELDLGVLTADILQAYRHLLAERFPAAPVLHASGARLVVSDSAGRALLRDGAVGRRFAASARWPEEGVGEVLPVSLTVEFDDTLLSQVIPGGLPGSPWPLGVGSIILSIVLAVVTVLTLRHFDRLTAMREEFVAGVTHEIRTPITQILLYGESLQLERPTPETRRRAAEVIVREARRLSRLVENALAFARNERPDVGLEPVRVHLTDAARAVAADLEPLMAQHHSTLAISGADDTAVMIDPGALRQIIANLAENAVLHGPDGQVITLRLTRDADLVRLVVSDQGPGVPKGDRHRIWEPFYRGRSNPAATGTGLGLSIVRQLTELHGGTATVDDAPGGGARFILSFPAAPPQRVTPANPGAA